MEAIAGYQAYLKQMGKELDTTNIKTKLLSLSMEVLSSIGWTVIIGVTAKAIQAGIGAINNYIHCAEKCAERVDKMVSSFNFTRRRPTVRYHNRLTNGYVLILRKLLTLLQYLK